MTWALICTVALLASALTFFSGFGLGTLLLPAFALFFPVEVAVSLTAVVHFLNGLFKLVLVGRQADLRVAARFGVPALLASFVGAALLVWLSALPPLLEYRAFGRSLSVEPLRLAVAVLMAVFAALELWPRFKKLAVPPRYLPLGGLVTGFFGGLSGHQGAFRSVFLLRAGLEKEQFIATGVVIAVVVDVTRLSVYARELIVPAVAANWPLVAAATATAFLGAFIGNRVLKKVTLRSIESVVAVMLFAIAVALGAGLL